MANNRNELDGGGKYLTPKVLSKMDENDLRSFAKSKSINIPADMKNKDDIIDYILEKWEVTYRNK